MIFICFIVNRSLYDRFSLSSSLLLLLESILVWSILIAFIIITIIIDPCMINSSSSSDRYTRSIILLCFILSSHYCRSIYSIDLFFFFLFIRSIRSTLLFFSPSYRYVRLIILLFLPLHLFFHKIDKFDLVILFFFFSFFFHKINYSDLVILIFFFFIKLILRSLFHSSGSFSSPILVLFRRQSWFVLVANPRHRFLRSLSSLLFFHWSILSIICLSSFLFSNQ